MRASEPTAIAGSVVVRFERVDFLAEPLPAAPFDIIVSTGVIHHLTNPAQGVQVLADHLADDGHLILWLYHPFGEFDRLIDRELARTLLQDQATDFDAGQALLRQLGLSLSRGRYSGQFASKDDASLDQNAIDADAYLHPIVNAYRFDDAYGLARGAGLSWAALHSFGYGGKTALVDLDDAQQGGATVLCLRPAQLFEEPGPRERYLALPPAGRARVIELRMKPTGFAMLAGRAAGLSRLDARLRGNAIDLHA